MLIVSIFDTSKPFAISYFLNKRITVPLWLTLVAALAAYAAWEIYWFTQVGINFIKWHTHYAVFAYLWFGGVFLFSFIKHDEKRENIVLGFSSFLVTLIVLELLLSITGFNKTYIEQRGGFYQSLFNQYNKDSLRAYPPLSTHRLTSPEYDYSRETNGFGFSDVSFYHDTSKILIQTYGDSFTEGDGAPADSSYPAILRMLLGNSYMVQNYGICGNDPGFYVTQFGKVGSRFTPDVIVLCYGTGDLNVDVMSRGGLERFNDSGWQTRKGPWWEVIYGMSSLSRLVFHASGYHYNNFFLTEAEFTASIKSLEPAWNEIFSELARLAAKNNTRVLLFKKPERSEIELKEYQYNMAFFDSFLLQHPIFYHVDLLPFYRDSAGLISNETTAPYYWPQDGHHNSKGYAVMARGVHSALKSKLPELRE